MKILIATEDLTDRLLLQLMLSRLGHEARPVSDGAELLANSEHECADVVLLDVQAPVLNGCKAVHTLVRSRDPQMRPLLIGLTAALRERSRHSHLEREMDAFLLKPVEEAALRELLERCGTRSADTGMSSSSPEAAWIDGVGRRLEALGTLRHPREAAELIADFLLAADHHVVSLGEAMIAYDQPALIDAAHDLAVLTGLMGLDDLSAQCRELEVTAEAGEGPLSTDLRLAVADAYRRFRPRLLRYRTDLLTAGEARPRSGMDETNRKG